MKNLAVNGLQHWPNIYIRTVDQHALRASTHLYQQVPGLAHVSERKTTHLLEKKTRTKNRDLALKLSCIALAYLPGVRVRCEFLENTRLHAGKTGADTMQTQCTGYINDLKNRRGIKKKTVRMNAAGSKRWKKMMDEYKKFAPTPDRTMDLSIAVI